MRKSMRGLSLGIAVALAAGLVAGTAGFEPPAHAQDQSAIESYTRSEQANLEVFDEVWSRVRDSFYDPSFRGLDWDAVGARYRAQVATPGAHLARTINRMLAELGVSHTGYYTPDETAYYDLADIFARGLKSELARHFGNGEVVYAGLGMLTRNIDGRHFVSGVLDGYPAAAAGLAVGDELIAVAGVPFEPVRSFAGKAGKPLTLTVRRRAGGQPSDVIVTPQRLHPNQVYLEAMEKSARIIETGGHRIGYVHIWSYARLQYQELLEDLLTTGKLKDADSLIWDLRDGWGGADPGYLDIFNHRSPTMTLTERDGDRDVVNGRWRKPVVLLINGGTRSGKEVLAHGFKKYALGHVVGTRSAGALLAGRAYVMSDGSLLLLAVADVSVDGERLEGRGVTPTVTVPFDIRYAQGSDPQLAKAIELLTQPVSD